MRDEKRACVPVCSIYRNTIYLRVYARAAVHRALCALCVRVWASTATDVRDAVQHSSAHDAVCHVPSPYMHGHPIDWCWTRLTLSGVCCNVAEGR